MDGKVHLGFTKQTYYVCSLDYGN